MTTSNTYNPLLNALRELTKPQAFRWYGTQAKATATVAMAIAHNSTATITRLFKRKPGPEKIALAEATAPEQAKVPANWLALEANEGAAVELEQAISSAEVQPEATELEQEPTPSAWAWAASDVDDVAEDEPRPEADEAKEPAPTQLPSDLSSLIQDYLQQKNRISSESVGEEAIAHSSFAPTDSDRAAGADAGD